MIDFLGSLNDGFVRPRANWRMSWLKDGDGRSTKSSSNSGEENDENKSDGDHSVDIKMIFLLATGIAVRVDLLLVADETCKWKLSATR